MRKDKAPAWEEVGKYATDLFTDESIEIIKNQDINQPLFLMISHLAVHAANEGKFLEAPQEAINEFKYISDPNRRTYAG